MLWFLWKIYCSFFSVKQSKGLKRRGGERGGKMRWSRVVVSYVLFILLSVVPLFVCVPGALDPPSLRNSGLWDFVIAPNLLFCHEQHPILRLLHSTLRL